MKTKAIQGTDFWNTLNPDIEAGGGVGHFHDGDVQFAAMWASVQMVIIHRTAEELFETTVRRAVDRLELKAVINGNFYDVSRAGLADAFFGHDPVVARHTTPAGHVVVSGSVVGGSSEPERFYAAFSPARGGSTSGVYEFGVGNPPIGLSRAAFGGLGPMIMNTLRYGNGNRYRAGVPAGAPTTGPVPAAYKPFLVQRNNNTYVSAAGLGQRVGKVVLAICRNAQKILLLVQPDGAATGITLDGLRDKLAGVGVDDAVFLDGSDSVMLNINGTFHVGQGPDKDETCTTALGFLYG